MSRKFSFDHIYSNEVCGCHQSALKENFRVRGQCHNDECSLTLQMSDVSTAVSRVRFGEMCEQSHTLGSNVNTWMEEMQVWWSAWSRLGSHGVKRPTAGLACSTLPVRKALFPLELLSGTSEPQVGHTETTTRHTGSPHSAAPRQASGNWRI